MPPGAWTTCVRPEDYEDLDLTPEGVVAVLSVLGLGPVGLAAALPAVMSALDKICHYLLHGKLVCLGGDQCAIGRVASFETVDDKSFPDNMDDDFSINLLLCPHSLTEFKGGEAEANFTIVSEDGKQGFLIKEQPNMPLPRESPDGVKRYRPYSVSFKSPDFGEPVVYPTSADEPFSVPVLHCECEGERTHAVCVTLSDITSLGTGGGLCSVKVLGIPVGKVVCAIIGAILAPIVVVALIIAWATADPGNPDDHRLDPEAGSLEKGDTVVIVGRWSYDAGHQGWNELHPVRTIQKIPDPGTCDWATFDTLHARWCAKTREVPHKPAEPGVKPAGMTPEQDAVWDAQLKPENRWYLHPFLDGCEPEDDVIK